MSIPPGQPLQASWPATLAPAGPRRNRQAPHTPRSAGPDASPEAAMDETPMDHYQMRIPAGTPVDGAVVELSPDERGIITAVLRIPAPQPGRM